MPTIRRLSAEEIARLQPRRPGVVDLTEYRQFLESLTPGEGGEVTLGSGDTQRMVKRRLSTTAKQLNKQLKYRRGADEVLRFEVQGRAGA
jgi:hypothetical protein